MTKTPLTMGIALAVAASALAPAPSAAQNASVSEVIVYGTDPCPRSTDDEVVVCARKPETERYRIPERLRQGGSLQSRQAWAVRAKSFETVGATGINSCSAVGPAGHTGCLDQLIENAFAERREQAKSETTPR
ncbi:hypothetical protein [Sphingomonas mesophila]|uniref:hypothetical protein n=1 Tax=Sphingomonas mesophila TaxID=2303576 RepID=UPI000E56BFC5|nr:hypothetical protein [Sphingomonas mesophila]